MLTTALSLAARADKDINAFVSHLGGVVDADQDEPNVRVEVLERRDGSQQHAPGQRGTHANFELPMQRCISPETIDRFIELLQHLDAVSVEARAFGGQL